MKEVSKIRSIGIVVKIGLIHLRISLVFECNAKVQQSSGGVLEILLQILLKDT